MEVGILVPTQMRYNIIWQGVGARHAVPLLLAYNFLPDTQHSFALNIGTPDFK